MPKASTKKTAGATDKAVHETIDALTFEMALVVFRLTDVARELLGQGKHSSGRRSVLKSLGRVGPQTVPHMAKLRSVSRQHVQKLVNGLLADGLVKMKANPQHKRSRLIALSAKGERFLEEMKRRERGYLEFLAEGLAHNDLKCSLSVVKTLREKLDSDENDRVLERVSE